jgi:hypothetical protein
MRDIIDIISEAGLTPAELAKHGGQYLRILIDKATKSAVEISPDKRTQFGNAVKLAPETIAELQNTLKTGTPLPAAPMFIINGKKVKGAWSALYKSGDYTGRATPGTETGAAAPKTYNAGHLAELFMGLSVSAKFFSHGNPVTVQNIIDMFGHAELTTHINPKTDKPTTNLQFEIHRDVHYPEGKTDTMNFLAVVPGKSAQAFINQYNTHQFPADVQAVLASAVRYVNESETVKQGVEQARRDKNSNRINVTSDGTSDAKGTKADLILTIDGKPVTLLSLKTYGTDTIGQMSGVEFATLASWFKHGFDLDIKKYAHYFDPELGGDKIVQNIFKLYDEVIYPEVESIVEKQSPGKESKIVRRLADAANFHARGEKMEDVEVVKLDDTLAAGSYKILRFSDNLYDAMKLLKLEARKVGDAGGTGKGRTIQIWVKPEEGVKVERGANRLCQFRSQVMGGYLRNYFEIGPMMVKLTELPQPTNEVRTRVPELREARNLGRARR